MPFLAAVPAAAWLAGGTVGAGLLSYAGASKAASGAEAAAATQAGAQQQSLDYLKERESIPQFYREQALGGLAGMYGLSGYAGEEGGAGYARPEGMLPSPYTDRSGFIEGLESDPFYQMRERVGREGALGSLSATGQLRSGTAFEALGRNRERALAETYGQRYGEYQDLAGGLGGLAGMPSYAPQIAQTMSGIGQTQAQGQVASGQAWQTGMGNIGDILLGGIGTGIKEGTI